MQNIAVFSESSAKCCFFILTYILLSDNFVKSSQRIFKRFSLPESEMDCKKSLAIFLNNSQDTGTLVDEIEKLKHYTKTANYVKYGRMTWL